jgi:hypothetical protein
MLKRCTSMLLITCMLLMGGMEAWAQTNFSFAASGAVQSGEWSTTTGGMPVHSYYTSDAWGAEMDGTFTGTVLQSLFYSGTTSGLVVTIDGGAPATITTATSGAGNPTLTTLATVAEGQHAYKIVMTQGVVSFFDIPAMFTVTGTAPAMGPPSSSLGQYFSTQLDPFALPSAAVGIDGSYVRKNGIVNYSKLAVGLTTSARIRFRASTATNAKVRLFTQNFGQTYLLRKDGTNVGTYLTPTTVWGWFDIPVAADATEHVYEVILYTSGYAEVYPSHIWRIMLPNITLSATALPPSYVVLSDGDSITHGDGFGAPYPYLIANTRGWYASDFAVSGQAMHGNGIASANLMATLLTPPTRITCMWGRNDAPLSITPTTHQSEYTAYLNALITTFPGVKILVISCLDYAGGETTMASYRAAQAAAVAAIANPNVTYVDVHTALNTTSDTIDGTHPSDNVGQPKLAASLLPYLQNALFFRRGNGIRAGSRSSASNSPAFPTTFGLSEEVRALCFAH